jgi:hypothetical protein
VSSQPDHRADAPPNTVILRHQVSPSASPMTGSGGVSSTPQVLGSITSSSEYWIIRGACHRARIRATRWRMMTNNGVLATSFARGLHGVRPKKQEGAVRSQEGRREDRVRAAPEFSCAKANKKTHMSIQVQRKQSGLPCAMVLTVYFVLSPARPCFVVTVARKKLASRQLDAGIGASGPHDLTVRLTRRSSKAHPRPPLPAPTSVTMANAPSLGTGWAK